MFFSFVLSCCSGAAALLYIFLAFVQQQQQQRFFRHRWILQNDTMRVVYMYHESDPLHGSVVPGSLPNARKAFKGYKPIAITQRLTQDETMSTISYGTLLAPSSSSSSHTSSSSISASSAQLPVLPSQSANSKLHVFELLNEDVKLPAMETLHWCKVFEFQEFSQKQHLVKVSRISRTVSYACHSLRVFVFLKQKNNRKEISSQHATSSAVI